MQSKHRYICVYGASSNDIPATYIEAAYNLGKALAERQWRCINGAGTAGVMRAVSDGFLDHGEEAVGIIPKFMVDNGWHYSRLTRLEITPDMHSRKEMMADMCECAIAMPGGCGTLEELLEIITWRQLKIFNKPLVILNIDGYYDPLIAMLQRCIDQHFMRPSHTKLWYVANSVDQAVEYIDNYDEQNPLIIENKY